MAISTTTNAALDFLDAGTNKAMNMAYKATPIELWSFSGNTEVVTAPSTVPKAHPQ